MPSPSNDWRLPVFPLVSLGRQGGGCLGGAGSAGGVCHSISYSSSFVAGTGHPSFVLSPVHQGESAVVGDSGSVAQGCNRPSVCLATGIVNLYTVMGLPASSGWTAVPQGSSVLACWLAPTP